MVHEELAALIVDLAQPLISKIDDLASRVGMETLSPPFCLHRCQGLEERAALGSPAGRIASALARHSNRSCSATDLKV